MSATTIRVEKTEPNYLSVSDTTLSWLLTTDHKRIAVLYLASLTFFSCVAVAATMIVHAGLLTPHGGLVSPSNYQQSVTIHGVMMVFFLLFPAIPAVLGNFVLPLLIGARNLALPRLSRVSWYLYVIGGAIVLWSVASGEIGALWTFSPSPGTSRIPLAMLGLAAAILSSLLTSFNIFLTIHKMRTQGLTWFRLPLFAWSLYAFSIAFIVGILAGMFSLVLTVQRGFASQAVAATLLSQPLFWLSFQPTMFLSLLPALGIISEVITCFSRRRIFGYPLAVFSILAIPPFAFLGWGQYLLAEGETTFASVVCSLGNVLVAALVMIQLLIWILTMYKGDITLRAPMFYALGCAALLTIGGVTGLFLAALPTSVYLRDTFFALAHLHYVVAGGVLFGFLTGLHFWWVKITGRMYSEFWAKTAAVITFAGVNLAFFPHLILGLMGMPHRYQWYPEGLQPLYVASTAGMLVLLTGCTITAACLLWSLRYGQEAGSNPWNATGLEWQTGSPPVVENFAEAPEVVGEPYGYEPNPS